MPHRGARPIPIASLDDILGPRGAAFPLVLAKDCSTKLALKIESGEILDPDLPVRIDAALTRLRVRANDCAVIADFCDADFTNLSVVAEIAKGALEDLQEAGDWKHVVFQGTNYPDKNPASPDNNAFVPRNEWLAWRAATEFDRDAATHLIYGDYAADCSKFEFKTGGGGRAIRHYRYATEDKWLVVRGAADGRDTDVMADVCKQIVGSGYFSGQVFSSADKYIYQTSKGWDGPGNAMIWRAVNTTHHITRVVRDIGGVRGMKFVDQEVSTPAQQLSLLTD